MPKCYFSILMIPLLACCCGCETKLTDESVEVDPTANVSDVAAVDGGVASAANAVSQEAERMRKRFGELFGNVLPTLDEARLLVDRHETLPDDSSIPFKEDKVSNAAALNELLDQAIEVLGVSEVSDYRQRIRDANAAIAASHEKIADYQRERVSASYEKDLGRIQRINPFEMSKEAIDEAIKNEKAEIESQEELLVQLKKTFASELSKIGVKVDEAGLDSLLSSVSGDDIVTMAVVFDNIKLVTTQLQELTESSGEALDVSKRYYGMYVVMIHVMDRIQKTFVRDVLDNHIPRLKEYEEKAQQNIAQAEALIKVNGGDSELLQANIASNRITRETAQLYAKYLKENAEQIAKENKLAQKNLATAMNTYDTVKLSSDVATLMKTGRRDFETLMRLQVPSLREFDNETIRKEFEKMTGQLRASR
ncbi:hypothetical protein [Stieleria varia]|uniref:Uncharacterized protein n=1 Tax=Stieleria varia TaxID=2528005 RepID=A0A5C6B437_9BACT|nr:hypothetical protein [Stieleria varia]TWU06079.1 hypothetical protein Pla52n_17990 [Stieleria varia]